MILGCVCVWASGVGDAASQLSLPEYSGAITVPLIR